MKRRQTGFILILFTLALAALATVSSCKKNKEVTPPQKDSTSALTPLSDEDSLKYLMYGIMQVSMLDGGRDRSDDLPSYYWYSQVPSLNPMSAGYANADSLLSTIKGYPMNPQTGNAIDRYSFLDRTGSVADEVQNGIVDGVFSGTGTEGDFGLDVTYAYDQQNQTHLIVLYADKNSPAGLKGIQRGWEITAVNGNTAVAYDGANGSNVTRISDALFNSSQVTLTFQELNNTSVTYSLDAAQYNIDPILYDTVYTVNNRKVGYFVLYTFSAVYNSAGAATPTRQALDKEFEKLTAAGVNDLIVDLRYNGGGAVNTAEYLDSAIAPSTANGKVMYNLLYNDKLTKNASQLGLDSKEYFSGTGTLNLDHVFFIVSRSTASASELTLNNLKPYMDVKLVGDTTYGKPVGFIDFTITDYDTVNHPHYLADLYAIDFETKNANNQGGYFQGIPPDQAAGDYVNIPWGDARDENLAEISGYISTGSFARISANTSRLTHANDLIAQPRSLPSIRFNGMIDYKLGRQASLGKKP